MRPGVNAALQVNDLGEAALHEEIGYLQAAHAVVAQTSDGLVWIQFRQSRWHFTHGNGQQLETVFADAGGLHFPGLAHVEQHRRHGRAGGDSHAAQPTGKLAWRNLRDHA